MKKLFLLTITAGLAMSSFAQNTLIPGAKMNTTIIKNSFSFNPTQYSANKTTNGFDTTIIPIITDSVYYTHMGATDTIPTYYLANLDPANVGTALDSGYFLGTGAIGITNFAERYSNTANNNDSMQVLGMIAGFLGSSATPSTHNVSFNVWSEGAQTTVSTHTMYSGMPDVVLKTMTVPYSSLTFSALHAYWFPTPSSYIGDNFFVGISLGAYTYASMNGDSLSTLVSQNRVDPVYTMSGADSIINNQSVVGLGTTWLDLAFDAGIEANYYFFPIVNAERDSLHIVNVPGGITKKNFTFHGNYPNPAVNYTNVDFTVANNTDVTIQVMDINGRTVRTINENNVATGRHTIRIETSDLAAGDYVYLIRTTEGGGIASKISVIK